MAYHLGKAQGNKTLEESGISDISDPIVTNKEVQNFTQNAVEELVGAFQNAKISPVVDYYGERAKWEASKLMNPKNTGDLLNSLLDRVASEM